MEQQSILVRADASTIIGSGHIMRCLALAQAWQDAGGRVTFLMAPGAPSLELRLRQESIEVLAMLESPGSDADAEITAEHAKRTQSSWIVVDGYQFGANYQKKLKEHHYKILFIDDYGHADHYYADIVLNQNVYANMSYYRQYEPYTRFLLGSRYALLRREFLKSAITNREIPFIAEKILVSLGGGDPQNITHHVINGLKETCRGMYTVKVVIGMINPYCDHLREAIKGNPDIILIKNAENMPELMTWADLAISGGGSTCLEMMYMGLPMAIIQMADNQSENIKYLKKQRVIRFLGDSRSFDMGVAMNIIKQLIHDKKSRQKMSETSRIMISGNGSHILTQYLSEHD